VDDGANGYEQSAREYMRTRRPGIGPAVVQPWAARLPRGAAVLDLGCGHGVPIMQVLVDAGLDVHGVDASPTLLAACRARFPAVRLECGAVERSPLFDRSFAAVVAWGLLFLLPPQTQRVVLARIAEVLEPGGQLLFTAPAQACTWNDALTGRPSSSLGYDAYRDGLRRLGLVLVRSDEDDGGNFYYFAQREGGGAP
jgi:SAM-dependent methyltransferase